MNRKIRSKGFTLIELIVVLAIIGVLLLIALPQVQRIQNNNRHKKYETYKEAITSATKIYIDTYKKDIFGNLTSSCTKVKYSDLKKANLIKDFQEKDIVCSNDTKTYVMVRKANDEYKYETSIVCINKSTNKTVYEYSNVYSENCILKQDNNSPVISVNPENTANKWKKSSEITIKINIQDEYGLNSNTSINYYWHNKSKNVNSKVYSYDFKNSKTNKNGNNIKKVSFTIPKENIPQDSGKYQLIIVPKKVEDIFGNTTLTNKIAEEYLLDNIAPSLTIKVYKRTNNGGSGTPVSKQTTNTIDSYQNTVNGWLNNEQYPYGVYYEWTFSDDQYGSGVSTRTWKFNKSGLKYNSSDINKLYDTAKSGEYSTTNKLVDISNKSNDYTTLSADGYRKALAKVTDKAGNSVEVNIIAPIDKTAPKKPTISMYEWKDNNSKPSSSDGLKAYHNNTWTGKKVYIVANSTDTLSGLDYYEYTTTGKTKNETKQHKTRTIEADGESTIKYKACDKAGNCSGYSTATIKIDKQAPKFTTLQIRENYSRCPNGGVEIKYKDINTRDYTVVMKYKHSAQIPPHTATASTKYENGEPSENDQKQETFCRGFATCRNYDVDECENTMTYTLTITNNHNGEKSKYEGECKYTNLSKNWSDCTTKKIN